MLAILRDESARQRTPCVARQSDQFKKENLQVVAVTLRGAVPRLMACVEVDEHRAFRGRVADDVVEMQIAMRPCAVEIAALNLMDPAHFAGGQDEGRGRVLVVAAKQGTQTAPAGFRNDHGAIGDGRHVGPVRIQRSGAMNFPGDPFVGSKEHADAAWASARNRFANQTMMGALARRRLTNTGAPSRTPSSTRLTRTRFMSHAAAR